MAMTEPAYTVFAGDRRLATGSLREAAAAAKPAVDAGERVLVFDDATARPVDLDFRGDLDEVLARLPSPEPEKRGPGRPKLGVVAREVTLLPRHWDWLNAQPGGASVALRRLVEAARRDSREGRRQAQETAYRFLTAMAGDRPGFEEAMRALFAGNRPHFDAMTEGWPADVRDHGRRLAVEAF